MENAGRFSNSSSKWFQSNKYIFLSEYDFLIIFNENKIISMNQ